MCILLQFLYIEAEKGLQSTVSVCLSVHSSTLNWVLLTLPTSDCGSPHLGPMGGATLACGIGNGGTLFRRLDSTLVLYKANPL
jgi:hypothetical protein